MSGLVSAAATVGDVDAALRGRDSVLFFWAAWHEPSQPGGQMDQVVDQLAKQLGDRLAWVKVEAEACPEASARFGVASVPTFVFVDTAGQVVAKVEGADPPRVAQAAQALAAGSGAPSARAGADAGEAEAGEASAQRRLEERLRQLVAAAPVMLFMKGTADEPKCKFSRPMVEILKQEDIEFGTFNILEDDEVRQGLKSFSNWPTFPQLYVRGDFAGGIDVIREMHEDASSSLKEQLGLLVPPAAPATQSLDDRCRELINQAPVMLFMKGSPDAPECGFSETTVELLRAASVEFNSHDILTDPDVRAHLKVFSNWPTFPQLYVKGELIGGVDIVREMADEGDLKGQLGV